jgi:hypothetical protein
MARLKPATNGKQVSKTAYILAIAFPLGILCLFGMLIGVFKLLGL